MEDIFVSAKNGNPASVKGLYAGSLNSAYTAVSEAVGEESAVEIVQQAYIAALSEANTYEEFFRLLNKRATSACALQLNKNVTLRPIEPSDSAFADPRQMAVPEALQTFDVTLCGIAAQEHKQSKRAAPRLPQLKKKDEPKQSELQRFEEMVKKHEFSDFDTYTPPAEPEQPKTLAEKLQGEDIAISKEQLVLDRAEKKKNKNAAIIALAFSAIILVGAISTYFITKTIVAHKSQKQYASALTQTEPSVDKTYTEGQVREAYWDYLNTVLVKKYGKASREKIVAYSQNGNVGSEWLNGIVSYFMADMDGDGTDELGVVMSTVQQSGGNQFIYSLRLSLFAFESGKVVPVKEEHPLIEYRAFNKGLDYTADTFKMFVKHVMRDGKHYLYTEAGSAMIKICSFHYFENGDMFEAQRFVYFAWDSDNIIYMQRRLDGTYEPIYLLLRHKYSNSLDNLDQEQQKALTDYYFNLSGNTVRCHSVQEFRTYFNEAFSGIGYRLASWNMSFDTSSKRDYICLLAAKTEHGDMLSYKNVVKIADYTDLDTFLKEKPVETTTKPPQESTAKEATSTTEKETTTATTAQQ